MSNNAHELSNRLLNALDNNYNVVDMHAVNEIISILEKINITKELLETTRLGKHVNELRRKTSEPTLARRAKVLVKRWRDLVIPATASPHHAGSNRSSAERTMRRLGGTPITSPAFARQVVSPAVPSPRPPSRPAWGGYESDSQDVILVDDDPPPAAPAPSPSPLTLGAHKPASDPAKRPLSPEPPNDDKKAKRDKKPKKRRGHSRAGSGTEAAAAGGTTTPAPGTGGAWLGRNGAPPGKKNGVRGDLDPYAALVNRMPPAGAKKVKTTKELLAQIQSRGSAPRSPSPGSPASPDVLLIEPDEPSPIKPESPLRNGGASPRPPSPAPRPPPAPLEDPREPRDCTCGAEPDERCPAARRAPVLPVHVHALHHAHLPGINGTRAPLHPHQFAVRKLTDPDKPDLFTSIVPLYNYSDYADDYCVKNMSRVPLCTHLPWTEFAPAPPELAPAPDPPPIRPYPVDEPGPEVKPEVEDDEQEDKSREDMEVDAKEEVKVEPSERLKPTDETVLKVIKCESASEVPDEFASEQKDHRTVEKTKSALDGQALYDTCQSALRSIEYSYGQTFAAPTVTLPEEAAEVSDALEAALSAAAEATERDGRGRPSRSGAFAEWHECARLGELVALPYVVID
ncbi:proteoglycan 4-like isoform X1 [Cydia pomonella]|uniref:proteoglycan 4-like isoform X1 n=3 Tax=Cydia pomonella TaxID=82600 RepID=UPI002ADDF61E|nr:proteoglycan 4-like isoform X1 [Cydia pomonella]